MNVRNSLFCCAALVLSGAPALADEAATGASPGKIAVVRASGRASLVLDATPDVAAIVSTKASDDDAKARLERDALRAVHGRLAALARADTITVHVVYARTPDVSPAYGSLLSQTLEHYADVELAGPDARADRERWQEAAESGSAAPAFVRFTVTGALPPR